MIMPLNTHLLEFTRKDKDQDILLAFGWALRTSSGTSGASAGSSEGTSPKGSLVGLDYRFKMISRFSADSDSALGGCVKYIADNLADVCSISLSSPLCLLLM